jgi:hypothetical protein
MLASGVAKKLAKADEIGELVGVLYRSEKRTAFFDQLREADAKLRLFAFSLVDRILAALVAQNVGATLDYSAKRVSDGGDICALEWGHKIRKKLALKLTNNSPRGLPDARKLGLCACPSGRAGKKHGASG